MRLDSVPGRVRLSSHRHLTHTVVAIHGDLGPTTAPPVRERLFSALHDTTLPMIIDLAGVSSGEAAGLAPLIGVRRRGRLRGITVSLAAPRPYLGRLLRTTGLHRGFAIYPTVATAETYVETANARPARQAT
ncbi:MAG TPA: STAS domain-containing protein [Streptosporangiaceae bacterium]|nr:STAS domain-containing protein [Streptosporangiaceae bacterium]